MASITNHHKLGDFTTQIHSFIVLMDKSWKSRCQKDYTSSERCKGDFILASSAASGARQSLIVVASYPSLPLTSQNLLSSLCIPHRIHVIRFKVHLAKSQTGLSDFTFTFHFHALEKEMATHSTVLAWRIPGTGEPGKLPSMGVHRVGHDWSDLAAAEAAAAVNPGCSHSRSFDLIPFIFISLYSVSKYCLIHK